MELTNFEVRCASETITKNQFWNWIVVSGNTNIPKDINLARATISEMSFMIIVEKTICLQEIYEWDKQGQLHFKSNSMYSMCVCLERQAEESELRLV